jgi:hypothetical protein
LLTANCFMAGQPRFALPRSSDLIGLLDVAPARGQRAGKAG